MLKGYKKHKYAMSYGESADGRNKERVESAPDGSSDSDQDIIFIDPFSIIKHCDVFLWAELSWRQKESPDRITNASCEVC